MILEYSVVRGMGRLARVRVRLGDWRGTYDLVRNFRRGFLVLECRLVLRCLSA